ncbi:hypothetical protein D9M69_718120 [compost metagenome]
MIWPVPLAPKYGVMTSALPSYSLQPRTPIIMAVSCMKPSPWPLLAYSGSMPQKSAHSPFSHICTTRWSSVSRKGLQTLKANSGARPFCAKRWLNDPLARKATVPS